MKILLIGAEGTLGQYLVSTFQEQDLIALSRKELDITKFDDVGKIIEKFSPDIVINSAAYNDVEGAETDEGFEKANLINGAAVGNLAKSADKINSIFVHFSTDYIFDGDKKDGYNESDAPLPINNYGKSKLLGEQLVQNFINKFYIIRMSRLFGKQGSSEYSKKSFVDIILDISKEKSSISVIDDETSSPTYALDATKAIKDILLGKFPFGIYHVTNLGRCTWYQFAKEIFSICSRLDSNFRIPRIKPISANEFPRKASRPRFSILVNTKLPPLRHWQIALEEYLKTKF